METSGDYIETELFVFGAFAGLVLSSTTSDYLSRSQALDSAEFILFEGERISAWRDENIERFSLIDSGPDYQAFQELITASVNFLVRLSFELRQERSRVLNQHRTCIDLTAELYGDPDRYLDLFIRTNQIEGDELFLIRAGRQIVWYV